LGALPIVSDALDSLYLIHSGKCVTYLQFFLAPAQCILQTSGHESQPTDRQHNTTN